MWGALVRVVVRDRRVRAVGIEHGDSIRLVEIRARRWPRLSRPPTRLETGLWDRLPHAGQKAGSAPAVSPHPVCVARCVRTDAPWSHRAWLAN
jgi:hypothetical protein